VAPSLATWTSLAGKPRTQRRKAAFVAGPRLRHAAAEVRELGALRARATVLHGRAASAEATLKALDGAALAHLACHGHFRADSPLFSSLELADGRLNVYELQQLAHAPEVVVLSACDLALSALHPGDELLGFAAALLGMGTKTIVASVVPVPDAAARRLMLSVHRELLARAPPATALARAQEGAKTPGFICLGVG
jgi:CHAT domain-containing protein